MEKEAKLHRTENCSEPIFGYKLEAGDVLEENDMYDSTTGKWEKALFPGATIPKGLSATWVRLKK